MQIKWELHEILISPQNIHLNSFTIHWPHTVVLNKMLRYHPTKTPFHVRISCYKSLWSMHLISRNISRTSWQLLRINKLSICKFVRA